MVLKTNDKPAALLALEDGRVFDCASFTGPGEASGEIVFNTGMTGYQEILTDPSYNGQMVVMTYPLIGTYGVNSEDMESEGIRAEALIVKEYQADPSNHRAGEALADFLRRHGKMGIEGLDTRALTRHIRTAGAMRAFVSTANLDPRSCIQKARAIPPMVGRDLTRAASTCEPYRWVNGEKVFFASPQACFRKGVWTAQGRKPSVAAIDYGAKHNILRCLEASGFEVIVVPAATNAADVMAMAPDAVFLSNGPGDPEPAVQAVRTVRELLGYRPMFGICLGHQLMALALGGKTFKLKFGHRGGNQPVKHLATGRVEITSQNHGFAVAPDSLDQGEVEPTHINLNDGTLEGFRHRRLPLMAVQYHPEAAPGPHDAGYLFETFRRMIAANP
ncbi:glutamine-hydrolyzing carbamoyl-phosphate synthase small subunit [Desulfatitalea sp. M08but]|uniref:Carbamoyl phosphate synthase small chain n=1 Tax=Desulfatitalea alkaliphila TaxID=2929485 RepID=A0AA41R719_9BACT|nr:glutamine-hydrolyzing carbamoyl-phosphate synthase small subunit [Desulfatitalea alkaliphila]MCJ8502638.1 glutamine-hydrolyzing carbamoyl-phosphate synthase small subunit [Desulfatitalea alkaliphila]